MDKQTRPDLPQQIIEDIKSDEDVRNTVIGIVKDGLQALEMILASKDGKAFIDSLRKKGLTDHDQSQQ